MSGNYLSPEALQLRYDTNRARHMTLVVTRQNQEFVIGTDIQLCDVQLINATAQLVGPGPIDLDDYKTTISSTSPTYVNRYPLYGTQPISNAIDPVGNNICYDMVDVQIEGLTRPTNILVDHNKTINQVEILVNTDIGLSTSRGHMKRESGNAIRLEGVHLQPVLRVRTNFMGFAPLPYRQCRFMEDFCDLYPEFRHDGSDSHTSQSVRFWCTTNGVPEPAPGSSTPWAVGDQYIPPNCISRILLEFRVTPRVVL